MPHHISLLLSCQNPCGWLLPVVSVSMWTSTLQFSDPYLLLEIVLLFLKLQLRYLVTATDVSCSVPRLLCNFRQIDSWYRTRRWKLWVAKIGSAGTGTGTDRWPNVHRGVHPLSFHLVAGDLAVHMHETVVTTGKTPCTISCNDIVVSHEVTVPALPRTVEVRRCGRLTTCILPTVISSDSLNFVPTPTRITDFTWDCTTWRKYSCKFIVLYIRSSTTLCHCQG